MYVPLNFEIGRDGLDMGGRLLTSLPRTSSAQSYSFRVE